MTALTIPSADSLTIRFSGRKCSSTGRSSSHTKSSTVIASMMPPVAMWLGRPAAPKSRGDSSFIGSGIISTTSVIGTPSCACSSVEICSDRIIHQSIALGRACRLRSARSSAEDRPDGKSAVGQPPTTLSARRLAIAIKLPSTRDEGERACSLAACRSQPA